MTGFEPGSSGIGATALLTVPQPLPKFSQNFIPESLVEGLIEVVSAFDADRALGVGVSGDNVVPDAVKAVADDPI